MTASSSDAPTLPQQGLNSWPFQSPETTRSPWNPMLATAPSQALPNGFGPSWNSPMAPVIPPFYQPPVQPQLPPQGYPTTWNPSTAFASPTFTAPPSTRTTNEPNRIAQGFPFTSAAAAANSLSGLPFGSQPQEKKITSAFDVLGVQPPQATRPHQDQGERFIAAMMGERKTIPSWNGVPNTLRSWLKMLSGTSTHPTSATARPSSKTRRTPTGLRAAQRSKTPTRAEAVETFEINTDNETWSDVAMTEKPTAKAEPRQ